MNEDMIENPLEKKKLRTLRTNLSWIMGILTVIPIVLAFWLDPRSPFKPESEDIINRDNSDLTVVPILIGLNFLWIGVVWFLSTKASSPLIRLLDKKYSDNYQKLYVLTIITLLMIEPMVIADIIILYILKSDFIIHIVSLNTGGFLSIGSKAIKKLGVEKVKYEKLYGYLKRALIGIVVIPVIFFVFVQYYPELLRKIVIKDIGDSGSFMAYILSAACGIMLLYAVIIQYSKPASVYKRFKEMYQNLPGIEEHPELLKAHSSFLFIFMSEILSAFTYIITGNAFVANIIMPISIVLAFLIYGKANPDASEKRMIEHIKQKKL